MAWLDWCSRIVGILTPFVLLFGYWKVAKENVKSAAIALETAKTAARSEQASIVNGQALQQVSRQVSFVNSNVNAKAEEIKTTVSGVADTVTASLTNATVGSSDGTLNIKPTQLT